jgi:ABC-type branched-subunit amino acid transport system ATPase component
MTLLQVSDLTVRYGGLVSVDHVSLAVDAGRLVALIGPNGAGKTSLVDAITGFTPCAGRISFAGRDLHGLPAHKRAAAGLARTWQSVELFDDLSVVETLAVAAASRRGRRPQKNDKAARFDQLLDRLGLDGVADRRPTELPQGHRKLVGLARALAGQPLMVCLDEPAAGLDGSESRKLGKTLRDIASGGLGVLLIDHDMELVLSISDYVYVLNFGTVIAEGSPAAIRSNARVLEAYLGKYAARRAD